VVAYRHADYGTPLRVVPATRGARYHRGTEDEPTQYLCEHPLGPLAELMRNHDLRTHAQVLAVRVRTWALKVDTEDLPEITFDDAGEFGIDAAELVSDDPEPCRSLADRLRATAAGLVVPSAALPGTRNIVLFGARVAGPYLVEPISPVDVPAGITAHGGRPIRTLIDLTRYRRERHRALEAWRRGDSFVFEEPDWELARA
jgi:RES domain-containing protein